MLSTITLLAAGSVSIVLPSEANSKGLEISVAEIATVRGDDAAEVARVQAASLGYAPAPGFHRTLRSDLVLASLRQSLPGIDLRVEGAPRCRVTPTIVEVTGAELRAVAGERIRASLAGLDASAEPEGMVSSLQLPDGEGKPRLVAQPIRGRVTPGIRSIPVEVWIGDKLYRSVSVDFRVALWERRAVLQRAVLAGTPLDRSMFTVERVPVAASADIKTLGLDEIAGAVAIQPLPKGAVVHERDVHREVVLRRGDTVSVRVVKGSVVVTDVGIAKRDARMGERVNVQLRSTGVELVAVARGRRTVEVKIQ